MTIYIFIYIVCFMLVFVPKNKFIYCLLYFALLLIGGLRDLTIGTDTSNYYDMYRIIKYDPSGVDFVLGFVEPGWVFLNYLCGKHLNDYRFIVFIGVFLAITPFFFRVWKSYKNPFGAIFFYITLFFYYNSFNITRQMIAVSIIIFSLYYLEKGKNKKFYLGVLTAMMFHYSSILCLSFPLLMKKMKLSTFGITFSLLFTYACGVYIVPRILPALPYIGRYSVYLIDGSGSGSITRLLLNLFFIFVYSTSNNHKLKRYFTLFFIGIVIYNLFAFSSSVGRIALYFMCTQFLLLSTIDSRYKLNTYMLKLCSFLYATIYYITMLNANSGEIIPYKIWE